MLPPKKNVGFADESTDSVSSGSTDSDSVLRQHMKLLDCKDVSNNTNEALTAPIFTESVRVHALQLDSTDQTAEPQDTRSSSSSSSSSDDSSRGNGSGSATESRLVNPLAFSQYGLLAGDIGRPRGGERDPRIFYNIAAPSSTFICGSQGSGKSHSLSCLLENCLIRSQANELQRPLTGIVFHYDTFHSDTSGSPCEAAYLSSHPDVSVRVLCAPTNVAQIRVRWGLLSLQCSTYI